MAVTRPAPSSALRAKPQDSFLQGFPLFAKKRSRAKLHGIFSAFFRKKEQLSVRSQELVSLAVPLFHVFVQTAVFQLLNKALPLSLGVGAERAKLKDA